MATTKRERQKANRQLRLHEMAKQARKQKRQKRGVWIGVLVVLVIGIAGISALLSDDDKVTVSDLVIKDLVVGTGDAAKIGDTLSVHYVGMLLDGGKEFDRSQDPDPPFSVVLGAGGVIEGWQEGLIGVQVGGTRQLDIPARLAYGDTGSPPKIGPGEALRFVIDVVSITPAVVPVPVPTPCPAANGSSERETAFEEAPPMCIDATKTYTATVVTNLGEFTITLDAAKAPLTVNNFVVLARYHFYDELNCHRIPLDFVAQCGDPSGGTGSGGPGYTFADELPADGEYQIGSVVMANSSAVDTNGSQFFIVIGNRGVALPANYSLFGQVTDGLDTTVNAIALTADETAASEAPTSPVIIQRITITES